MIIDRVGEGGEERERERENEQETFSCLWRLQKLPFNESVLSQVIGKYVFGVGG